MWFLMHRLPFCFGGRARMSFSSLSQLVRRHSMSVVDEFRKANEVYGSGFQKGDLALPPARQVAVVVCMDARIDPARALGLEEGDAHVIRNAGGRVADALRSLIISEQLLGTRHVVVIHHT